MTDVAVSRRPHLEHSPLVLVLCEIRFSPVLAIDQHVTAIQDHLRNNGFPDYSVATQQQIQFGVDGGVQLQPSLRWSFASADKKRVMTLTTSSIALQVTDYRTFEDFQEALRLVVDVLSREVQPGYADRIGLRYVDAVVNVGSDLTEIFTEAVTTFSPEELGVESLLSSQQILARSAVGQLLIRMNQVENTPILPPDLLTPDFPQLAAAKPGIHAILDIDSSDESRTAFNFDVIEPRLWSVHGPASAAFWKSVRPEALKKWGLVPSDQTGE
ncbi:TIGR04255 family protein [Arthrobacter sp. TB 26]|uniref:TIGR04255 family protein n=1 Tax=Arthrobacter sp. TB 26 TaxID=494420 RepID=UPI000A01777A|nr:TIGR04255 family protein [Arthrobacter sp. TB 26]